MSFVCGRMQKFKLSIANTVVTHDNSSLQSMGTSELLDLFDVGDQGDKKEKKESGQGKQTAKGVLENMESLWDEKQYETEYDLGLFMESLKWAAAMGMDRTSWQALYSVWRLTELIKITK